MRTCKHQLHLVGAAITVVVQSYLLVNLAGKFWYLTSGNKVHAELLCPLS